MHLGGSLRRRGGEPKLDADDPFVAEIPVSDTEEDTIAFDFKDADNRLLLDLFFLCYDQLIIGPAGPMALDLKVLPFQFDIKGVQDEDRLWLVTDLKSLTQGFLEGA